MKKSITLTFTLALCITSLYGQEYNPWNASLNFTPYYQYVIIAPAVSRSFGERFEAGIMPIFQYYKRKPSDVFNYEEKSFGLNITGRYFIGRGQKMNPYVSGVLGFGTSFMESSFNSSNGTTNKSSSQSNFADVAIMLGNEVNIGKKGWIFDFNVGLLGTRFYNGRSSFEVAPIYSFGIKKKFLHK